MAKKKKPAKKTAARKLSKSQLKKVRGGGTGVCRFFNTNICDPSTNGCNHATACVGGTNCGNITQKNGSH
jgi:hypothetical protein